MADMSKLVNARTCSSEMFGSLYQALQSKASEENEALYQAELRKAKTHRQRQKCAGRYCGKWQTVFNAWVYGKIPNTFVQEALLCNMVSESLLVMAE